MSRVVMKTDQVRERLAQNGITQAALAVSCRVDLRTVQRWLAGQSVRLSDAERVAEVLGVGTADAFAGVPEDSAGRGANTIRRLARFIGKREWQLAHGIRAIIESYPTFSALFALTAHPARGFVQRVAFEPRDRHSFVPLRVRVREPLATMTLFEHIARSVRVAKARIIVRDQRVWIVSNFEAQSMTAPLAADGSFTLWVWAAQEAKALVCVASADFTLAKLVSPDERLSQLFDMSRPELAHAICMRPGRMQLMAAQLPEGFDRVANRDVTRTEIPVPSVSMDRQCAGTRARL